MMTDLGQWIRKKVFGISGERFHAAIEASDRINEKIDRINKCEDPLASLVKDMQQSKRNGHVHARGR